jgi:hypothetical protein
MKSVTTVVTTAPRKECTLYYCLSSIEVCGWTPIVFAEPDSTETHYETHHNPQKLGIWHNWLKSAKWALDNSNSEYILTVQDDSLFHPESKQFFEVIEWPHNAAFVSFYTPRHYTILKTHTKSPGINRIYTRSLWGACALMWPRSILDQVINHPIAQNWCGARPRSGIESVYESRRANPHTIANSDTAIGKIINAMGMAMYFIDPSPVQHISPYSTLPSHGGNGGNRNCYRCADPNKPLFNQIYP